MAKQYYANGDRKVTGIFCTINLTGKPEICPVHTIDFSIIIVKSNGKKFYRLTNEVINFQNAEGNVIDRAETIEKFN